MSDTTQRVYDSTGQALDVSPVRAAVLLGRHGYSDKAPAPAPKQK